MATADASGEIIHTRYYIAAQGYEQGPAILYQDNMSTLHMLGHGRPTSGRSRHISIKQFYVKDRVDSGEMECQYMPTGRMIADILTKPLQGALFKTMKDWVLGGSVI